MALRRLAAPFLVFLAALAVASAMTYPVPLQFTHVGRTNSTDGMWSLWTPSWVARTLVVSPSTLYDANIFHPHRGTLAYSEPNLGAGVIALPVYWATGGNPYASANWILLAGLALAASFTFGLVRALGASRGSAAVAAIAYGFCPFVFARTAHVQLQMIFGLPMAMWAMHRLVDRPGVRRAVALALALVVQALSCGYYGILAAMSVGAGALYYAIVGRRWRQWRYWFAVVLAFAVFAGVMLPFFLPFRRLEAEGAPFRSLEEAAAWSANWSAYLASAGLGHRWMHRLITPWNEVLFPGFVAAGLGLTGLAMAALALWRGRGAGDGEAAPSIRIDRSMSPASVESIGFYALVGGLAFWLSFGPQAGLYTLFYKTLPVFSMMRAPGRLGIMVALSLAVIAGLALDALLAGRRRATLVASLVFAVTAVELAPVPLRFREAVPVPAAHRVLATLPRGPVVEFPFFYRRIDYHRHAFYMLLSTAHWQPLVNGYSDFFPRDFTENAVPINAFPSKESFALLRRYGARYALFHLNFYDRYARPRLLERLEEWKAYLRPLEQSGETWLFEIVAFPDP